MIRQARELSREQRVAVEGILGRTVREDEAISVRSVELGGEMEWLRRSWQSAKEMGVHGLSAEEIDDEIRAARGVRRRGVRLAGE